jgi:triacylglycerol esterase/lipase EstA (alpha/beta hydrolase family)
MSKNLYLDTVNHDLTLDSNYNLRLTTDMGEFLSQKIENRLQWFYGEWFLNPSGGVPYFENILGKKTDLTIVNSIFKNQIGNIDEVDEVLNFETDYDGVTRTYNVNFTVRAVSGEVVSNEAEVRA